MGRDGYRLAPPDPGLTQKGEAVPDNRRRNIKSRLDIGLVRQADGLDLGDGAPFSIMIVNHHYDSQSPSTRRRGTKSNPVSVYEVPYFFGKT